MREIKFRAWFNGKRKMVYNLGFDDRSFITLDDPTLKEDEMPSVWDKDCIIDDSYYEGAFSFELMQYTGLHDKNGVKIFEGDIVVAWSVGHRAVGEVKKRIDGLWIMYPAYQKGKLWGLCPNSKGETSVEIIGNIHENKELLENR